MMRGSGSHQTPSLHPYHDLRSTLTAQKRRASHMRVSRFVRIRAGQAVMSSLLQHRVPSRESEIGGGLHFRWDAGRVVRAKRSVTNWTATPPRASRPKLYLTYSDDELLKRQRLRTRFDRVSGKGVFCSPLGSVRGQPGTCGSQLSAHKTDGAHAPGLIHATGRS
jgi:hypothetical protein